MEGAGHNRGSAAGAQMGRERARRAPPSEMGIPQGAPHIRAREHGTGRPARRHARACWRAQVCRHAQACTHRHAHAQVCAHRRARARARLYRGDACARTRTRGHARSHICTCTCAPWHAPIGTRTSTCTHKRLITEAHVLARRKTRACTQTRTRCTHTRHPKQIRRIRKSTRKKKR